MIKAALEFLLFYINLKKNYSITLTSSPMRMKLRSQNLKLFKNINVTHFNLTVPNLQAMCFQTHCVSCFNALPASYGLPISTLAL